MLAALHREQDFVGRLTSLLLGGAEGSAVLGQQGGPCLADGWGWGCGRSHTKAGTGGPLADDVTGTLCPQLCGSPTLFLVTLELSENWETVFLAALGLRGLGDSG